MEKCIKTRYIEIFCENSGNPFPRASPDQFYNFVWVDNEVNNETNSNFRKSFEYLGYKGFKTFDTMDRYINFINSDETKNNIFVFTGGDLTDKVINETYNNNKIDKKV